MGKKKDEPKKDKDNPYGGDDWDGKGRPAFTPIPQHDCAVAGHLPVKAANDRTECRRCGSPC